MFIICSLFSIGEFLRLHALDPPLSSQVRLSCNDRGLLKAKLFRSFIQSRGNARRRTKGNPIMRKLMVAAALASTAFATPALARDGAPYVWIDAGLLKPSDLKLRLTNSGATFENAIRLHHRLGVDADAVVG